MTICYFGDFDPDYSRNRVLVRGLRENGVKVILCQDRSPGWKKIFNLWKRHRELANQYDLVIVGYSDSRWPVWLAWLLSRKRIAWDAFYSRYDSWVSDRQLIRPGSFKAAYHWLVEWLTCRLVDVIFLDTESHIKFFEQTFNLSRSKFRKVLVGSDDRIFYPVSQKVGDYFAVNFHGNFIPLQGIEVIVRAAKLLEQEGSIRFNILGSGQTFGEISGLVDDLKSQNVKFWPKIDYAQLPGYLAQADVVLGIFGTTPKADRVIPNKVYEAAAMGKPIITAETSAIKELFTDRHDILLCHAGDPADLAAKILELKNKPELATNLGRQARLIFENNARPSLIAKQLLADLD